jgi:hypothetical protein
MLPAYFAIPDFFADARAMRAAFDGHFADPTRQVPEVHQVWNYWNIPGQYTYLRTQPEKIIPRALCDRFFAELMRLAVDRLGMTAVTWPYLSLYVSGCSQGLHNDARNGRLGYVFSLTEWETRRFAGGETMIFRDQRYFGSEAVTEARAAHDFYDLVPTPFNQLLVFDDRIPHAVPRIEGTMEPRDGRLVLHGHIVDGPALSVGALPLAIARAVIAGHIQAMRPQLAELGRGLSGVLTMRITLRPDGQVEGGQILYDRLLAVADGAIDAKDAINAIIGLVRPLRFPATAGPSVVTFAIPFGPAPGP